MKQGVQENFPHNEIREGGCYFLCLVRWAEVLTGKEFSERDAIVWFEGFKKMGWLEDDGFIVNPISILNAMSNTNTFKSVAKSAEFPSDQDLFIAYLKKSGHGHFVLSINGKIWDPLPPCRPGVNDYKVDSYRVLI